MNTRKYLLLTALCGKDFGTSNKNLIETIHEYKCTVETTEDIDGYTKLFVSSKELGNIERLCTENEIKGLVVEYAAIFDQSVEED